MDATSIDPTGIEPVSLDHGVRARMRSWPHEHDVAHLVLFDHRMVPADHQVRSWIDLGRSRGARAIRTSALFPLSTAPFLAAGFEPIDELALLELSLTDRAPTVRHGAGPTVRTAPLRTRHLDLAAAVDRRAFPPPWGNDRAALLDALAATPRRRARSIRTDGALTAYALSGIANDTGFLQRLAVDPDARRNGFGRRLATDALGWMHRRGATTAMVNTAFDNEAALALYHSLGFHRRDDSLTILELRLDGAG